MHQRQEDSGGAEPMIEKGQPGRIDIDHLDGRVVRAAATRSGTAASAGPASRCFDGLPLGELITSAIVVPQLTVRDFG
jgi:hypothetical protein